MCGFLFGGGGVRGSGGRRGERDSGEGREDDRGPGTKARAVLEAGQEAG